MTVLALLLAAAPVSTFTVTPDVKAHVLHVRADIAGWDGDCLCLGMSGAEDAVRGLTRHQRRKDCFARPKGPLRYDVSLSALRRMHDDPDYAADLGPAWLFHDAAVLVQPDDVEGAVRVRFELPPGVTVATPWPRDAEGTFLVSAEQFDAGAYIALGSLRSLGEVKTDGVVARVTLVDQPKKPSDDVLREWIRRALRSLATFYRGSPTRTAEPIHVVLAGVHSEDAGVFGSVLRRQTPSVMLLFGDQATSGFDSDWVAVHELFHLGNPPTQGRYPWFVEGFTTYYTQLLRARSGALSQQQAWGTLATSLLEFCQPDGKSLGDRSDKLRVSHDWMRVYWGGACLALRVDVAIRQHSHGAKSLDDVMRALRDGPALDEARILAALDQAAGAPVASSHWATMGPLPVEALLTSLGVVVGEGELAVLRDDAPLAGVRKALSR